MHWSLSAIGYFPTATLGTLYAAYAAMFYNQTCCEIDDLESRIAAGELLTLKELLNQKIHRWGRQFTSEELLHRVTGQSLSPELFLSSLEAKIGELST